LVFIREAECFLCCDKSEAKETVDDVWLRLIDWMQINDDKLLSVVNLIAKDVSVINCHDVANVRGKITVFVLKLSVFSFLEIIRENEVKELRKRTF